MASTQDGTVTEVRIALIGEEAVGKSSLLLALLEDRFCASVPPKLDKVVIPADVTPDNVQTSITDYSPRVQDDAALRRDVEEASVICVVYDVTREETLKKVTAHWLPLLRDILGDDHERPVILVGNKSDGSNVHTDKVLPIMEKWPEVETCVECSAKEEKNVSEIFYYAQKAVVCPTRPLYNADEKRLTDKCKKALIRVFKICDRDNDGYLNDMEISEFQKLCFGIPLTSAAIEDVKRVVSEGVPDGGLYHDAISLNGFLYLHLLFIERGRHETTWTVLRKFGYNQSVKLGEDYLYPRINVPNGCSTELSPEGTQFISALFEKHDEDKDGCLSPSEMANLFSICPTINVKEIMASVETNDRGWLTYTGFMAYWHMTTLVNVTQSLELLAHLGFAVGRTATPAYKSRGPVNSLRDAIRVTRERKIDLTERGTDRKVFQCLVVGAKDAGKTVFMQSLAARGIMDVAAMGRKHSPYVANRILVKEEMKYLVLREVDVLSPQDVLSSSETAADVVCFLYDLSNMESFAFSATIFLKYFYRTKTPCLFVATKVEKDEIEQRWEMQPAEFCVHHEMPRPARFGRSMVGHADNSILTQLATMAVYPHLKKAYFLNDTSFLSKLMGGAAVSALAAFLVYRNL